MSRLTLRRALLGQALLLVLAVGVDGLASAALLHPEAGRAAALAWWLAAPLLLLLSLWLAYRIARLPASAADGAPRRAAGVWLPPLLLLGLLGGPILHAGALAEQALASRSGLQFKPLDGGRALRAQGEIRPGDATRLAAQIAGLNDTNRLHRIELDSVGGSWAEARRLAALIAEQSLATRTAARCDAACTLLFRAGSPRQLMPGVEPAFTRLPQPSWQPWWRAWVRGEQARLHEGLSEDFRRRLALAPAGGWRPMRVDLVAAGVLQRPDFGLDVGLPPVPGSLPAEYRAALLSEPAWPALDRRFPGLVDEVAGLLHQQRESGVPDAMAAQFAQQLVLYRQTQLLAVASGETRQLYLAWLVEALGLLQTEPAACSALLAGDAAARRRLPLELAARELQWLQDASEEAPPANKPLNGLEREVIRRTLGDANAVLLPRLWAVGSEQVPLPCAQALRLATQIAELPGPQRRLALRRVFER